MAVLNLRRQELDNSQNLVQTDDGPGSPIAFGDAKRLHELYKSHPDCLRLPSGAIVKGFRIGKAEILDILSPDEADELFVYFSVHPEDEYAEIADQRFTLVFAPISLAMNAPYGNIIETGPIYEYVDPCPSKCPKNL